LKYLVANFFLVFSHFEDEIVEIPFGENLFCFFSIESCVILTLSLLDASDAGFGISKIISKNNRF
jgi:hypothetical protein